MRRKQRSGKDFYYYFYYLLFFWLAIGCIESQKQIEAKEEIEVEEEKKSSKHFVQRLTLRMTDSCKVQGNFTKQKSELAKHVRLFQALLYIYIRCALYRNTKMRINSSFFVGSFVSICLHTHTHIHEKMEKKT